MSLSQIAFDFDGMAAAEPVVPPKKKEVTPASAIIKSPEAADKLVALTDSSVLSIDNPDVSVDMTMASADDAISSINQSTVAVAPSPKAIRKKDTRGRKSLVAAAAGAALVQVPPDEELFTKAYYSMGQVAAMFHVTPSLLRLWENEFVVLKPRKNGKGDRLFRPEDIKMLQLIYHLLRERKYTMQGAKEFLKANAKAAEKSTLIDELKQLKSFLLELRASL